MHDLPYHKTIKKYENFSEYESFSVLPAEIRDSNMVFVIAHNIFTYFTLSLSAAHVCMIQERCWFSQIDFFCWVLSTSDQCFVSFQPFWCHPHTQIRIILFHDVQRDIPILESSPIHVLKGFSQIAFPITVLPKDDRTDFAQEERLGRPHWTMSLAICVVVDESKCLDTPIWEFSKICEHLPFLLGYKPILRPLLVHCTLAIWLWYPWPLLPSFAMLKILVQWILRKTLNHLSQNHLGVQLDLCTFGALPPIRNSSNDRCPSMMQNELLRPTSLLHRSHLSYFWLSSSSTPKFSPIFPIPAFAAGTFYGLRHKE